MCFVFCQTLASCGAETPFFEVGSFNGTVVSAVLRYGGRGRCGAK